MQDQARREGRRIHELVTPVEPDKGLAALPEPSDGDVFFDLEGDLFAADGGLEYLFGVADRDGNYNPSWALDPSSERRVFERFIDDVMARWEQHPGFHIYHYGTYETTAVKRLMSRYATREDEVDRLLRGRVFVDLHRVVRQGLRASVESYSLKALEPFYGFARALDLATATRAIIQVEAQLESGDAAGVPGPLRAEIEDYNRDDCLSTLRLAAWLEERRRALQALTGQLVPRPMLRDEERDREQEPAIDTAALFEALTAGLPADDAELDGDQRARGLLAHLLEFHRREDKSMWWEFFHRCGFTEEEHVESRATLGALTYAGEVGQVKRSVIHRYRFPEQAHEIEVGDSPKNPDTAESEELKRGFCGTVVALDEAAGTIELKRARNSPVPHPAALVRLDNVQNTVLRESLARLAEAVVSGGLAVDSPRRAAFDLLGRVPPRIEVPAAPASASGFTAREDLVAHGEVPLAAVRRLRVPVALIEDQHQFILHHRILWKGEDVDVAVPMVEEAQALYPALRACSFDRGFHSPANRVRLDALLDVYALPGSGYLSMANRERESEESFVSARRAHPAIESAINGFRASGARPRPQPWC